MSSLNFGHLFLYIHSHFMPIVTISSLFLNLLCWVFNLATMKMQRDVVNNPTENQQMVDSPTRILFYSRAISCHKLKSIGTQSIELDQLCNSRWQLWRLLNCVLNRLIGPSMLRVKQFFRVADFQLGIHFISLFIQFTAVLPHSDVTTMPIVAFYFRYHFVILNLK